MKKRIYILFLFAIFLVVGCGLKEDSNILDKLINKLKNSNSYYLSGNMEILNNEDTYTYDVEVSYQKGNYYKVNLVNTLNNHEQVILRNDDGVYVITPSLNKSYKFQSDWPYNNSQVYLLNSVYDDLSMDENRTFESKDDNYIFTSLVNFPNNKSLVKQKVFFDKNLNISKVEVLDKDGNVQITMNFKKIDFNKKFDDKYFELGSVLNINDKKSNSSSESDNTQNNNKNENNTNDNNNSTNTNNDNTSNDGEIKTKTTATIDDIIYPMYLPSNTYLANQQTIDTDEGQRLILTFDGDSSFILVEETIGYNNESLVLPVSGDIEFLTDVLGVVGSNSITWDSNGIEYYLVSDTIPTSELIEIAQSISVLPVSK